MISQEITTLLPPPIDNLPQPNFPNMVDLRHQHNIAIPTMSFLTISLFGKKYRIYAGARKYYWNYSPIIVERFGKELMCEG
jgi:hypothetical protein